MTGLIPQAHRPDRRLFAPRPPHEEKEEEEEKEKDKEEEGEGEV